MGRALLELRLPGRRHVEMKRGLVTGAAGSSLPGARADPWLLTSEPVKAFVFPKLV